MLITDYLKKSEVERAEDTKALLNTILEDTETVIKPLRDKQLVLNKKSLISYRQINHWTSLGLLSDDRKEDEKTKWRKFSLLDLIWQRIIYALREFGYSNTKLKETKDIWFNLLNESGKIYPLIDAYVLAAFQNEPVFLIIDVKGFIEMATFAELVAGQSMGKLRGSHIQININTIVEELFDIPALYKQAFMPVSILQGRKGLESVTFKYKQDGFIEEIQAIKHHNPDTPVHELFKKADFQNIEVVQRHGKKALIKQHITKRLKPNPLREEPEDTNYKPTNSTAKSDSSEGLNNVDTRSVQEVLEQSEFNGQGDRID